MICDKKAIRRAIADVRSRYPFPGIFDDTEATILEIADVLQTQAPAGSRLLDIGCGALDKPLVFQKLGYQCFACDTFQDPWHLYKNNLDLVLSFARESGVKVHAQGKDLAIPWEKGAFDIVTIINVVEHLHDSPRDILNFAGTCLKPGGLLVVNMPNAVNLRKRISVFLGRSNYTPVKGFYEHIGPWRGHVREYTTDETRQIIQWSGFEVVGKKTYHGMLSRRLGNPVFRLLFKAICLVFPGFKDGISVAARRPMDWSPRESDENAMRKAFGVPEYTQR